MEQFMKLVKNLENTVTADLDRIQEIAPETSEFTDNICINIQYVWSDFLYGRLDWAKESF